MMQHGMPKEEAWRAVREEYSQNKQLALDNRADDLKFLRKTWLAAEVQKTNLQIAKRNNIALKVCFIWSANRCTISLKTNYNGKKER